MTTRSRDHASDATLAALAARYVWWQPVDVTLREPLALLWSVLKIGTAEDYLVVRDRFGEAALIDASATRRRPAPSTTAPGSSGTAVSACPTPRSPRRRFE